MSIFALKMLSIKRKKELISLKQKKFRQKYGQFLVEGEKSVLELCKSDYYIDQIFISKLLYEKLIKDLPESNVTVLGDKDLQQISFLNTSPGIVAVANFKNNSLKNWDPKHKFTIVLDGLSDPGNLGTIIRIADWYGINTIICSMDCVDMHNPKVISSSMGSFTRVNIVYTDLKEILKNIKIPSYACVMNGVSIQNIEQPTEGLILIGNEANGLSAEIEALSAHSITIPKVGNAESLNAGIAAAIVCHKFILG